MIMFEHWQLYEQMNALLKKTVTKKTEDWEYGSVGSG